MNEIKINWLEKLKTALIVITIKGELRQPQNYAMGRVPKGQSRWHIAQQYIYDIDRILREMRAATSFVSSLPEDDFLKNHSISREDYIMYHQGYLLDLTHQLKDKACQLIKAVITPEKDYKKKKLEKKTKLSGLLKDSNVKKIPRLLEFLTVWDDDTQNGPIAKALKKRTNYHHYKNPLPSVQSYMRANSFSSMLDPKFLNQITEYGKKKLKEEAEKNSTLWHLDGSREMSNLLSEAEKNIDNMAKSLMKYYKFSTFKEDVDLINKYLKLDDLVRAKRASYSLDSLLPEVKTVIDALRKVLLEIFGENLSAIYVTGSIFREDFIPFISNLNFVIVAKENAKKEELLAKVFLKKISREAGFLTEIKVFSKDDFTAPVSEKIRFICLTDGLLLVGENLLEKERLPKVCFNLAWVLNKDFKDYVDKVTEKLKDPLVVLSKNQLSFIAREFIKKCYWLSFSMVIGNHVIYTTSFKKIRELQNFYYPENKKLNNNLYKFLQAGIRVDREMLIEVVESYGKKLMPLYEMMEKYCDNDNPQLDEKFTIQNKE